MRVIRLMLGIGCLLTVMLALSAAENLSEFQKRFSALPIVKITKLSAKVPRDGRDFVLSPKGDVVACIMPGHILAGKEDYIWIMKVGENPREVDPGLEKKRKVIKMVPAVKPQVEIPKERQRIYRNVAVGAFAPIHINRFSRDGSYIFFTASLIEWKTQSPYKVRHKPRLWKWSLKDDIAVPVKDPVNNTSLALVSSRESLSSDGTISVLSRPRKHPKDPNRIIGELWFLQRRTGKLKRTHLMGDRVLWSPDGKRIAYGDHATLAVAGRGAQSPRLLLSKDKMKELVSIDTHAPYAGLYTFCWLPDSRSLLVCLGWGEQKGDWADHCYLYRLRLNGTSSYIGKGRLWCASPDGKHLLLRVDDVDWVVHLREK